MNYTATTATSGSFTYRVAVTMGHKQLVHRHPKGKVHLYETKEILMGRSVREGDEPPEPDWSNVEHHAICDKRLTVTRTQRCGRLGDAEHPRSLLCKHCAKKVPA